MTMLLAVDVGNTHTVLGVFEAERLVSHWRIETRKHRPADEYGVMLRALLAEAGLLPSALHAAIGSTVVPPLHSTWEECIRRLLGVETLFVGPGIRSGMPILYESPREVGADRIVNAVAAYERVGKGVLVVDFGTATTFDLVSERGEYLGGVIAPGMGISMDALFHHAAKLPRVEIARPDFVVGRNTVASMQSGILFGYVALVDGLVRRIRNEIDFSVTVLATGGWASQIAAESDTIEAVDEMLTLTGLRLIHERNCEGDGQASKPKVKKANARESSEKASRSKVRRSPKR